MNRSFTTREKILLLLLTIMILGVGYFKLFYQPMQEQITANQQRQIAAEDQFSVEAVRLQRMKNMQNEIEQFKQSGATVYSEIPPYDNIQNVMIQLNTILGQAKDYSISFQDVQKQDDSKLVIRPIELSFTPPRITPRYTPLWMSCTTAASAVPLNRSRFRPTRIFRSIMISAFRYPSRSMKSRSKNKLPPNA